MKTPPSAASIGGLLGTLRVGSITTLFLLCLMTPGASASAPSGTSPGASNSPPNLPPFYPSGPTPSTGALGVLLDVQLTWSALDPDRDTLVYDVHFGTVTSPPTVATNLSVPTYTPIGLSYNVTYYWRVVVRDTAGHEVIGLLWAFTTRPAVCTPMNVAPPNNSTNQPQVMTLHWDCAEAGADPVVYDVYFGSWLPLPRVATGITDHSFTPARLAGSTTYWWRVHARNAAGVQVWSNLWSFTTEVGNEPPSPPYAPSPGNGATTIPTTPTLTWYCEDSDGDALEYDVYFGIDTNPPLVATGAPAATYAPGPLLVSTTYRWRIVARDPGGLETSGPVWVLTTRPANSPPWEPSYDRPWSGASNWSVNTGLEWSGGDLDGHPTTYDVYFGTDATPPLVATDLAATYYPVGPLAFTTRYYWRILARDPLGLETSGPTYFFTTKANSPPNVPSMPDPPHNGIGSNSPVLSWRGEDVDLQPLTYDVYIGQANPPPLSASSITTTRYSPPSLVPGVTYYWKVVASDGLQQTIGPIWSFVTRLPGDVVADNVLTVDDAMCAMEIYLWNPACATTNYRMADADCSANVTPGDARCLHREAVGLGCSVCDDAILASPVVEEEEQVSAPTVSLNTWHIEEQTLVLRLAVSGVPMLNAFGFYATVSLNAPLLAALRRGASNGFEVLEGRQVSSMYAFVGGYSLADRPLGATAEFVELRFDVTGGIPDFLVLDGFADDLAGAGLLLLSLDSMVGAGALPTHLALHQNYPNPFNPQTTISYELPAAARPERVRLRIVDVAGRVVRTLVNENQPGGSYRATWQGKDDRGESVSSGVYFYVLDAGGERRTRKLVLLK